jgi:hypothetical protein
MVSGPGSTTVRKGSEKFSTMNSLFTSLQKSLRKLLKLYTTSTRQLSTSLRTLNMSK